VLYDAVALLPSEDGAKMLVKEPAARDFIADAFAHMKFVGYTDAAVSIMMHAGVPETRDKGFIAIKGQDDCSTFVAACRQLRFWDRAKM
jgi:catalase